MMHPELAKLLELQTQDLALREIDRRHQALLDEVARLDAELATAAADLEERRSALQSGVKRREEIEAKVEGLRILQERRRQRVELAKTTRELQALGSELELARSILAREEAEWFRAAEQVTALEAAAEAARQRLGELDQDQVAQREVLAQDLAAVEAERAQSAECREQSAATLERAVRLRYDRLRQNRATAVVVAVRGDACGACFTAIPMNRRNQIRTGFLLEGCEACGVILYAATEEE